MLSGVGVAVGVEVATGVGVFVGVAVIAGVEVGVAVGVELAGVAVGVRVGVFVTAAVGVNVGVAAGVPEEPTIQVAVDEPFNLLSHTLVACTVNIYEPAAMVVEGVIVITVLLLCPGNSAAVRYPVGAAGRFAVYELLSSI